VLTLKTEKKAQERAYAILQEKNLANAQELCSLKELFHLYNVQYINDIIISSLELLYWVIEMLSIVQGDSINTN
jgi:Zn-dependent membrane protease YugP